MSAPLSRGEAVALLDENSVTRRSTRAVFLQYVKYLNEKNLDENGDPIAWPKAQTIADKIGYSLRAVRMAIAELTALGLLARSSKKVAAAVRHGHAVVRSIVLSAFNRNASGDPAEASDAIPEVSAKGAIKDTRKVQSRTPESSHSYIGTLKKEPAWSAPTPTPPKWVSPEPKKPASASLRAELRTGWRNLARR